METLIVQQGEFQLARYPLRQKETLRAWDAADEYLLKQIAEEFRENNSKLRKEIIGELDEIFFN